MARSEERSREPASFRWLTAGLVAAALVAAAIAGVEAHGTALSEPRFWILAGLALVMECLPIRIPRPHADDVVTVSSAFALAALFLYGALPALVLWTVAAVVADLVGRLGLVKAAFNAAQYALCMSAAALALHVAGGDPPLTLTADALPPMLAAAAVFFVVNHVLAGAGVALLSGVRVLPFLRSDLGLLGWTAGFQLALAPLLLGAPGALVAIAGIPVLAIYLGALQAAAANRRANHDALTGLVNRELFEARLADALARDRRAGEATCIALIDLDDFKSINDTLGHHSGDLLLRYVAERMQAALRHGDLLARMGGDEFALLLSAENREQAEQCGQRMLDALGEPVAVADLSLRVSASLGVAFSGPYDQTPEALLQKADIALYRAKAQRGGIALVAHENLEWFGAGIDRVAVGGALAQALSGSEVHVHFQPKVPMRAGLTPAMEALARWTHPQLGQVDPSAFVAIAEQTGMIKRLTLRVLEVALERCAVLRARGVAVTMCVNLSAKSLVDEALPATVDELLRRHGLPGDALQFEITESACVTNVPRSRAVLETVRSLGVTLAIDDFGTGFSSLSQLQALDLAEVKIDRSFVQAMEGDPQSEVIVRSVINLGHSLGLQVCAEGAESRSALKRLQALGCDYVQGFVFGQPAADASPLLLDDARMAVAAA